MRYVRIAASALVTLGAAGAALAADGPSVTFTKDVAPIVYKSCAECHRPTMFAPMSLMTYDDARPHGARDQGEGSGAADAAMGRRPGARDVQERSAPDRPGNPDDRVLGGRRRAEGRRRRSAEGAAVRGRLDDRQARRDLRDGPGIQDSRERDDRLPLLPRPDAPHRRQVDPGDRDQAGRARAMSTTCSRTRSRPGQAQSQTARSGRPTSAA